MPYKNSEERKAYFRTWAAVRREFNVSRVREYKLDKGCADCGYNAHHAGLEFDHPNDDKTCNVANLYSTTKLLWEEIAKCEVVCATCHAVRTYERLQAAKAN